MRQTSTQSLVEAGIMSAVAIVFALAGAYIPLLGPFVFFIWPVPIVLLGVRHGHKWSIMATVVAGIMIAILVQPLIALNIIVGFGLIGIVLGHAYRAGFSQFKTLLWGSVASFLSMLAFFFVSLLLTGVNPMTAMMDAMEKSLGPAFDIYRSLGIPEEKIVQVEQDMRSIVKLIPLIIPASFVLTAVFMAYINMAVSRAVLRRLGHDIPSFPPFREWTLPMYTLYGFVLSVAAQYLGNYFQQEIVYRIGLNCLVVFYFFLFIQGLALFYYLADKYNLSRLVRAIILIMIITTSLFQLVAAIAGIYDLTVDYRRLRTPRSS